MPKLPCPTPLAAIIFLVVSGGSNWAVEAPVIIPKSGDAGVSFSAQVNCETLGAQIHYTLNGQAPTQLDPTVASGGWIHVSRTSLIKAKAWLGEEESSVTTEEYRISGAVHSGYQHGFAISREGNLWSWGNQASGRLGNASTANVNILSPVRVKLGAGNFDSAIAVAGGYDHSVVLDDQMQVWAFGENGSGQLGNNSSSDSGVPVRVLQSTTSGHFLPLCIDLDAGENFSVALTTSHEPYTWGVQSTGRLGNGVNSSSAQRFAQPVERGDVPGGLPLTNIANVAVGNSHGMAREFHAIESVGSTGRVWGWGQNHVGQLGRGDTSGTTDAFPVLLNSTTELTDALTVDAGENHTAILRWNQTEDDPSLRGTVWCMGSGLDGRIGDGNLGTHAVTYPTAVITDEGLLLSNIVDVSAGGGHTLALDNDGYVWAWGNNSSGQLGDGSTVHKATARKVLNPGGTGPLSNIIQISAGGDGTQGSSMALATDGTIYIWGRNDHGQLGNGQTSTQTLPSANPLNPIPAGDPDISLALAVDGIQSPVGITLKATPTHTGPNGVAHIVSVEFFINSTSVSVALASPWEFVVPPLSSGTHQAFAVVTDDRGATSMSKSVSFSSEDFDGDGMPNAWEAAHGLNPYNTGDGDADPDSDLLSNRNEFANSTDPRDEDTDDDYVQDGIEVPNN